MKRGEVWWVAFDPSLGSEIQKTRPAIIVSNNIANKHLERVTVVPLTSNIKNVYPSEAFVTVKNEKRKALADQMMTVDKQRLKAYIDTLSASDMLFLVKAIRVHLHIS